MRSSAVASLAVLSLLLSWVGFCAAAVSTGPLFIGYCDGYPIVPGQPFVLYGLGEKEPAMYTSGAEYTRCSYSLGLPDVWLGESIVSWSAVQSTTVNLYVKQVQLSNSAMGGRATLWINSESGGLPTQTSEYCDLSPVSGTLYECSATGVPLTLKTGDRLLVVVTPPLGQIISPVTAVVELFGSGVASSTSAMSGYCNTVGNAGESYVLFGLGQRTRATCDYLPGMPVSSSLGEPVVLNSGGSVWQLSGLFAKQEMLFGGGILGGTVNIWLNPKAGGQPIQTGMSCTLTPQGGGIYGCSARGSYSVVPGDKVIAIVTPAGGNTSLAPVSVVLETTCTNCYQ